MTNLAYVQEQMVLNKRKELRANHPYSIWQGKEKNEDVVVAYWKNQIPLLQKYIFQDVYFMWQKIQDKLVSDNTVVKYETDYNRFFIETDFAKKDIKRISSDDVRIFMVHTIKRLDLPKETSRKLFGYITNAVFYVRKELGIGNNPVEFIKAKDFYSYCAEKYKAPEKRYILY